MRREHSVGQLRAHRRQGKRDTFAEYSVFIGITVMLQKRDQAFKLTSAAKYGADDMSGDVNIHWRDLPITPLPILAQLVRNRRVAVCILCVSREAPVPALNTGRRFTVE